MSKRKISVGDKVRITNPDYPGEWTVIEGGGDEDTALVYSTDPSDFTRRSLYVLVSDLVSVGEALDRWLGYDH